MLLSILLMLDMTNYAFESYVISNFWTIAESCVSFCLYKRDDLVEPWSFGLMVVALLFYYFCMLLPKLFHFIGVLMCFCQPCNDNLVAKFKDVVLLLFLVTREKTKGHAKL